MGANVGNNNSAGYTAEINITPLVDVVLVLLIIFMVIVPVLMRGHDVNVPGESTAGPADRDRPEQIVLYIEEANCPVFDAPDAPGLPAACVVHLNDEAVEVQGLAGRVSAAYENRTGEDRVLFLNARPALNYEYVMRILDAARSEVDDLKIGMLAEG
jgi:biopolymer transport protein ExbD